MNMKLMLAVLVLLTVLVGAASPAYAVDSGARRGGDWLRTNAPRGGDGAAADALVALHASRRLSRADARARAAALRRGTGRYARTAGSYAKVIIGLTAARVGSPRCAGRTDLLRGMNRYRRGGRYGSTLFDQTLAMMAARALGAGPAKSTATTLLRARGRGGWNLRMSPGSGDSVSSTAMAIIALRGAGVSARNENLRAALGWMTSQRRSTGGYTEDGGGRSQANPTALAIRAVRAMGYTDTRAIRALRSLQSRDGSFLFTRTDGGSRLLATNDAVVALAGRTLPVGGRRTTPGACT
jgi:hypothetical protein